MRAELHWEAQGRRPGLEGTLAERLAERYVQYRHQPFARVLVLRVTGVSGWAAEG
ncbi:MAG: hypothetical protein ACLGHT_05980 [Acidimicrobiia bacterium]